MDKIFVDKLSKPVYNTIAVYDEDVVFVAETWQYSYQILVQWLRGFTVPSPKGVLHEKQ